MADLHRRIRSWSANECPVDEAGSVESFELCDVYISSGSHDSCTLQQRMRRWKVGHVCKIRVWYREKRSRHALNRHDAFRFLHAPQRVKDVASLARVEQTFLLVEIKGTPASRSLLPIWTLSGFERVRMICLSPCQPVAEHRADRGRDVSADRFARFTSRKGRRRYKFQ